MEPHGKPWSAHKKKKIGFYFFTFLFSFCMLRFICTEHGGCFCDEKGGLSHQWKWNSIKEKDLDYIKKNLKKEVYFDFDCSRAHLNHLLP
jgi:hypothetical protein